MKRLAIFWLVAGAALAAACGQSPAPAPQPAAPALPAKEALIARAKALELNTPYVPPQGDPLEFDTAGFAKVMCSAVFVTGLDPAFAAENVGYFTGPYASRAKVGKPVVDRRAKAVSVTMPNGITRTAKYFGSQGCVALPKGETKVAFAPVVVKSALPDPSTQPWPMGDVTPTTPPSGIDIAKIKSAVDAAFDPADAMTAAFVVTWKGQIVGERYGDGVTVRTPLESWSMGKSITATLMGLLIKDGVYSLNGPAPMAEWQQPNDPRKTITIANLLNMSSGLRIRGHLDPDFDPKGPYPDHMYLYTGAENVCEYAATRPLQWPPGLVGRYHNTDPVLVNCLIRRAVEKRGETYFAFPQRALFDKIGIRSAVIEPDPSGNLLIQGNDYVSARDWTRLANLYLQNGVWNGERLLPEGFVKFVSTVGPAWAADKRPIYGGFFWINGDHGFPIPDDAYFMAGSGGQDAFIIPSHDLVVVRLGHYKGGTPGTAALKKALAMLMEAVPPRKSS